MRRRFFWAIFGVSTVLVLLLMVGVVGATNQVRERATRAELERAGRAIGSILEGRLDRPAVIEALRDGTPLAAVVGDLAPLRLVAGGSDIDFYAVGPQGVIGRDVPVDVEVDLDELRRGRSTLVETESPEGTPLFVYATPIARLDAREVVLVATVARAVPVDVTLPRGLVLLVVGAAAALAALMARVLSGRLTRQLKSVAEAAGRLRSGDLSARADVTGTGEIDTVATAFNEMASALQAARDRERQFLLSVGHDLRTPLTTITGYAEALEDGIDDPPEVRRIATVMGQEGRRLRRLIEDVMLLARLEAADFDLRPEPVDVVPFLDETLAPYRDRAAALRIQWSQALGGAGVQAPVMIDPDRVAQIVGNLVENALRHTPEAGSVGVQGRIEGDELVVSVSDTGPGIDPDDLPRIFDRFYVATKYRGVRPEGSGLGLSIVDRLVSAMGGTVRAESSPTGTVLHARIPSPPPDS